jgi:Ca2+-binding RTX toxin-like protein
MEITGTIGNDTGATALNGTELDDFINALAGNDTVNALGGDDIINGGPGIDQLFAGAGNDTFIVADPIQSNIGLNLFERFDGGADSDTIELRTSTGATPSPTGLFSFYGFGATVFSVEQVRFSSSAGETIQSQILFSHLGLAGVTQLTGGAGRDVFGLAINAAGTYTMPSFTLNNWAAAPLNAWEGGSSDLVSMTGSGTSANLILNAASNISTFQSLSGGGGNDEINGSENADSLNGAGVINILK